MGDFHYRMYELMGLVKYYQKKTDTIAKYKILGRVLGMDIKTENSYQLARMGASKKIVEDDRIVAESYRLHLKAKLDLLNEGLSNSGELRTINEHNKPLKIIVSTRLRVISITTQKGWDGKQGEQRQIKLSIVPGDTPENNLFTAVSGGTAMELITINPKAFEQFEVGDTFDVQMTKI